MWGKTLFAKSVFPHTPFHKKLLFAIPAIADAILGNRHFFIYERDCKAPLFSDRHKVFQAFLKTFEIASHIKK